MSGVALLGFCLLGSPGVAQANCAAGDGIIASPGTCTVPQNLTGAIGTIVGGATLTTGPGTTAYTVSSNDATVTNAGAVATQGPQAFLVNSRGSTLVNSGSIVANQGTAILASPNASLNIVNTGSITGGNGTAITFIPFSGGGLITQSAGAIEGTIRISGFGTTLQVTGGAINGSILDQTPASGAAGSSQGRGGVVNFDLGAGSFTTRGNINIGAVNLQSGTLVLQNDIYVSGGFFGPGLTNNATLQISGLRTLTGNFVQNAAGTLVMQVGPAGSSQLRVMPLPFFGGGTARLAGTLALAYQPGTYRPRTYTLISADDRFTSVTGTFSNVTGVVPTPGLDQTITIGPSDVQLTLSGVAAPANDTIYPATASALVLNGQWVNEILLDRLGGARQTGIADGVAAANGAGMAPVRLATKLYDRTGDEITLDKVERITI